MSYVSDDDRMSGDDERIGSTINVVVGVISYSTTFVLVVVAMVKLQRYQNNFFHQIG